MSFWIAGTRSLSTRNHLLLQMHIRLIPVELSLSASGPVTRPGGAAGGTFPDNLEASLRVLIMPIMHGLLFYTVIYMP